MRFAALLMAFVLSAGLVGCYDGAYRRNRQNDPWWNDGRGTGNTEDEECRRDRGRIDERKWRYAVTEFEQRSFRRQAGFRDAKESLLQDLRSVRERACDWEVPAVQRLIDRVRDLRYNPISGGVD